MALAVIGHGIPVPFIGHIAGGNLMLKLISGPTRTDLNPLPTVN